MIARSLGFLLLFCYVCAGPVDRVPALTVVNDCPLFCDENIVEPICGSDGRTYDNECELNLAQCRNPRLKFAFNGRCPNRVDSRGIICTTPMCPPFGDPVCGSDGLTYQNECELNNAMCGNESLKKENEGPCNPAAYFPKVFATLHTYFKTSTD
ncbi:agrin-like [Ruditapes philippinarum]|uniref:agrin-like n=1 Tax=Ruditapes philippinarum TaxID=129788 RepID=UPI00295A9FBE|nr:agrin-like [Ruditapes philippinarum]